MQKLAQICIRRPVFATMLILALVVLGLDAYRKLGVDFFPKVEFPFVTITTTLRGAAPEEVETQVTRRIEEAVNMLTFVPASHWGLRGRGLLREGFAADINVFDPTTIAPQMPVVKHDLPAGAKRLVQKADGIAATIVNGDVLLRDGEHTGALPGQLVRGPLAQRG